MSFAVYHAEKGKGNSGNIGNHMDREPGKEYSYQHADPERRKLNINFELYKDRHKLKLSEAVDERIKEGYKGEKAIRKDAVKFTTHVLTGSHEKMKEIFNDQDKAKEWIKENYDFMAREFGKENIVRFNLHMDEKTPHIHAVTVPLTSDGRLSAKEVFGNRKVMQNRQDKYADAMRKFGLERGKRSTGIKHESSREYYGRMKQAEIELKKNPDLTGYDNVLGLKTISNSKTLENHKKALERSRLQNLELKNKMAKSENMSKNLSNKNSYLKRELKVKESLFRSEILGEHNFEVEREKEQEVQKISNKIGERYRQYFRGFGTKQDAKKILDKLHKEGKISDKEKDLMISSNTVRGYIKDENEIKQSRNRGFER